MKNDVSQVYYGRSIFIVAVIPKSRKCANLESATSIIACQPTLPVGNDLIFSKQLVEFLELNNIDINDAGIRGQLLIGVRQLKNTVPVVHVTFAAAAEHEELAKFVDWVRQSVHPQAVLTVGLQPDLIGGAYVRTTNKVFDMSIRTQLASGRQIIKQDLEALSGAV